MRRHIWFFEAVTHTQHHHSHPGNRTAICDVSTIRSTYSRASLLSSIAFYRSSISSHHRDLHSLRHLSPLLCVCSSFVSMYIMFCVYLWLLTVCICLCVCFAGVNQQCWLISGDVSSIFSSSYPLPYNNEQDNLCSCVWPKLKTTFSSELKSSKTLLVSIRTNENTITQLTHSQLILIILLWQKEFQWKTSKTSFM